MNLELEIYDNQELEIEKDGLHEIARQVWHNESDRSGFINLILVDDDQLILLNKQFLNRDYKTDVIAFPLTEKNSDALEGEIYISIDRVFDNARIFDVEKSEELKRMVVHGLLHFLGYSDKSSDQKKVMHEREDYYLSRKNKSQV